MYKLILKNKAKIFLTIVITSILFAFLYKLYIPRINAFGCFDDCFNIVGGYFIKEGKEIYKNLFFNHQPGMAFISAVIQQVSEPKSIPELILNHRQVLFSFSFLMTLLITFRFGLFFLLFSVVYEFTKFYIFGDRFLGESVVTYFLVYQFGVTLEKLYFKKAQRIDTLLMPLFTWAVFFLREPFTIVTIILYIAYFLASPKLEKRTSLVYFLFFVIPTLAVLGSLDLRAYYFNLVTVNSVILSSESISQPFPMRFLKSFFYPIYLIVSNESWTFFRTITASLSVFFIVSAVIYTKIYRKFINIVFIFAVLTVANLRPVEANRTFYESFHISPWYALYIFTIIYFIKKIYLKSRKKAITLILLLLFFIIYVITNRSYFGYEKIDLHKEFFTNYSSVMGRGTIIRDLSSKNNTLFLDDYDDLVYFEAKLKPAYKYSWYTSFVGQIPKFVEARDEMFQKYPPDFYYGDCKGGQGILPDHVKDKYLEVFQGENVTCIHILKNKISGFTVKQKELIHTIYSLKVSSRSATPEK